MNFLKRNNKVNITNPVTYVPTIDLNMQLQQTDERAKMNAANNVPANNPNDLYYDGPKMWKMIAENWAILSQPLAIYFIFLLMWGLAFCIFPQYANPKSPIMQILFLFIGAHLCGVIISTLGLPDMLGMIGWGILYRNTITLNLTGLEDFEAFLRELALVNIMLLAGFGLDLIALKKLFNMVTRLTIVPIIAEVVIITILSRYLMNLPWLWGTLLGLIITAISPNVVISVLITLKNDRLGLNKGIHTLIIASMTCNDVISIFLFGVILGVIYSTGTLTQQFLQGPIGIGIGVVYGFLLGILLILLPYRKSKFANELRLLILLLGGLFSVIGSKVIGYQSAGALGCVVSAFVANIGWKRQPGIENNNVSTELDLLWKFVKPISFSLIGKEIYFAVLDGNNVGYGCVIILVGCIFRLVLSYVCTFGGDLNWKERGYVTISGLPKATVQAALAPVALDLARKQDTSKIELATTVLIVSVLAIIFTAPLGALLMTKLAPRWLKKSSIAEAS